MKDDGSATLHDLVSRLPRCGERPAVGLRREFGSRWWSYRRLHAETVRAAAVLARRGIQHGDRVVLWAPNSPEWVSCFLGAMMRGAVVVPIDDDAPPAFVEQMLREFRAKLLLHRPRRDLREAAVPCQSIYAMCRQPAAEAGEALPAPVVPDDPALIYHTSGTTSQPRGVVITHGNLMSQVKRFGRWRWLVRSVRLRMMVLAPLSHIQGMVLGVCVPLYVGLGAIYTDSIHPARLIRTLRDERLTLMATVPRALRMLGSELERRPYGRSTVGEQHGRSPNRLLRRHFTFLASRAVLGYRFWVVFVGGAPLPREDEVFWKDTGCLVIQGYGLTETTAVVSVNPPLLGATGSVGRPLAHQDVRLAEDGEILVRGPNVTPECIGPEGVRERHAEEDGFFRTGDLGRFDDRRRLYILGRKKDLIVTGEGFNVHPEDVESALNRQAEVLDSVVCATDREGHPQVHAVLLLHQGAHPEGIVARANEILHPHQRIRSWSVWPEEDFPRSELLKVKRDAVVRRLGQRRGSSPPPAVPSAVPSPEAICAEGDVGRRLGMLASRLAGAPGETLAREQLRLRQDLGLSSIDCVELLIRTEESFGVALDDAALPSNATVADLHSLIRAGGEHRRRRTPPHQPRWSRGSVGTVLRSVVRPMAVGGWSRLCARTVGVWAFEPSRIQTPVIFAAAPHRHWLDVLAICSALPRRLRGRLSFLTDRDLRKDSDSTRRALPIRFFMAARFSFLVPATFPFTVVPRFGGTRKGLRDACRLIGRGCSVIVFPKGLHFHREDVQRHDPGAAWIALQTGVPIVPVWLEGNDGFGLRPRWPRPKVAVRFERPVPAEPDLMPEELVDRVEDVFRRMAPDYYDDPDNS